MCLQMMLLELMISVFCKQSRTQGPGSISEVTAKMSDSSRGGQGSEGSSVLATRAVPGESLGRLAFPT